MNIFTINVHIWCFVLPCICLRETVHTAFVSPVLDEYLRNLNMLPECCWESGVPKYYSSINAHVVWLNTLPSTYFTELRIEVLSIESSCLHPHRSESTLSNVGMTCCSCVMQLPIHFTPRHALRFVAKNFTSAFSHCAVNSRASYPSTAFTSARFETKLRHRYDLSPLRCEVVLIFPISRHSRHRSESTVSLCRHDLSSPAMRKNFGIISRASFNILFTSSKFSSFTRSISPSYSSILNFLKRSFFLFFLSKWNQKFQNEIFQLSLFAVADSTIIPKEREREKKEGLFSTRK